MSAPGQPAPARRGTLVLLAFLALVLIPACGLFSRSQASLRPPEAPVREIHLAGPAARARAEYSGLAWYGDHLIMLPQYPERMAGQGQAVLFTLTRAEILAYLDGETHGPLRPREIIFDAGQLRRQVRGYEGYEAIAFHGDHAYLAIEASPGSQMKSFLVRGTMQPDLSRLALDLETMVEVPLPAQIPNFSNEALLVHGDQLIVFYEANGARAVEQPRAALYDLDLNFTGQLDLPRLEYRLTDAAAPTEDGRFWVVNFFFPLDLEIYTRGDSLAERYGEGTSHAASMTVERLVELRLPGPGEGGITLTEQPPLQLKLAGQIPRNWEGLVRLDERGFLLITDKFPRTMLAFVEWRK